MKKIALVLFLSLTITLTSCSHIEDANGSNNYSIVTFTDDDIINGNHSSIEVGTMKSSSSTSNGIKGKYSSAKLSGIIEVEKYKSTKENLSFEIEIKCESGNAMLVIVSDDEIVKKIEANQNITFTIDNNKKYYKLMLIGESAKVSVKYEFNSSN